MPLTPGEFQLRLLAWFERHGRKDLPWQRTPSPYHTWVSEIMLQQTQVATVIPYFERFIARWPDVEALAMAPLDEVLALWAGLGYYARARHLHQAAQTIANAGCFPDTVAALCRLPGIGRSTAGAIISMGWNLPAPILDGNVKRVLARLHGIEGWPGRRAVEQILWRLSERYTPPQHCRDYTQAIMDFGALWCTPRPPQCTRCPFREHCLAYLQQCVERLPTPKPTKRLPCRSVIFALFIDTENRCLLQRRPPTGVWGGLWSLPEFADETALQTWCAERSMTLDTSTRLCPQRHTFSHFHLDYTPLIVRVRLDAPDIHDANDAYIWHTPFDLAQRALPAPVRRLVAALPQNVMLYG